MAALLTRAFSIDNSIGVQCPTQIHGTFVLSVKFSIKRNKKVEPFTRLCEIIVSLTF